MTAGMASLKDLEVRWRKLSASEQETANALIQDAYSLIRDLVPGVDNCPPDSLVRVVCAMVKRAMNNPADFDGVTSTSITEGPFSRQYSFASPGGDLYLSKAELKALKAAGGVGKAFEVNLLAGRGDHV